MLAFGASANLTEEATLGVIAGSLISGGLGYLVLRLSPAVPDVFEPGIINEIESETGTHFIESSLSEREKDGDSNEADDPRYNVEGQSKF